MIDDRSCENQDHQKVWRIHKVLCVMLFEYVEMATPCLSESAPDTAQHLPSSQCSLCIIVL